VVLLGPLCQLVLLVLVLVLLLLVVLLLMVLVLPLLTLLMLLILRPRSLLFKPLWIPLRLLYLVLLAGTETRIPSPSSASVIVLLSSWCWRCRPYRSLVSLLLKF
jgi:hypothetical protein